MSKTRKRPLRYLLHLVGLLSILSLLLSYLSPYIHPETARFMAFFGLAYPITILLNFILLILLIILRTRWAIAIGLLLLAGLNFHLRIYSFGSDKNNIPEQHLKFMSYNCALMGRYAADSLPEIRRKGIISYLHEEMPDILCLQEFYHQDPPTNFTTRDTIIKVLQVIDYHELYRQSKRYYQNFGVCIMSKYPIIRKGSVAFNAGEESNNFCIYADIVTPIDTIRVYNTHFQSIHLKNEDYELLTGGKTSSGLLIRLNPLKKVAAAFPVRAKQAEQVRDHVRQSPHPVVLCGDFNDPPMSYTYNIFNKLLIDAHRNGNHGLGVTYTGTLPAGRIDYIFHDKSLESTNFEVQKEVMSDHRAIQCSIFQKTK